jgi:hypothetical protein
METSFMSESLVDASDVEETVTQVLTQLVQGIHGCPWMPSLSWIFSLTTTEGVEGDGGLDLEGDGLASDIFDEHLHGFL